MAFFRSSLLIQRLISIWLYFTAVMVLCMVVIGGVTRLTNSGLSIVEWKPVTGVVPPLNESEWQEEFGKYRESPEYKLINNKMDLEGFKKIFWLEFIHRLAGRLVGIAFFIPAIIFWLNCKFDVRTKRTIIIVSILGIMQGIMGWYMVKSGLVDAPYVSHFRLTLHLLFAVAIFSLLLNEANRVTYTKYNIKLDKIWLTAIGLTVLQIALGGLVAGLDAGLIYTTFPFMGENFLPEELLTKNPTQYLLDPAIVQFLHRCCAYTLTVVIFYLAIKLLDKKYRNIALLLTIIIIIQFSLGVSTLLMHVPVIIATLHQFFGFILLGVIITSARTTQI